MKAGWIIFIGIPSWSPDAGADTPRLLREIWLRMAIGARRLHVLLQILAASVFLRVTGGIAGIIIWVGFSAFISLVAGWSAPISAAAIGRGFLFSAVVGIFFGYYPARKAAHLDPIEAMRYE